MPDFEVLGRAGINTKGIKEAAKRVNATLEQMNQNETLSNRHIDTVLNAQALTKAMDAMAGGVVSDAAMDMVNKETEAFAKKDTPPVTTKLPLVGKKP